MPFVTEAEVRERHGFATEQTVLGSVLVASGNASLIKLDSKAWAVGEIVKNGTLLTGGGTDYTFNGPSKNITLIVAAIAGDEFVIEYDTELASKVLTRHIDQATAVVRSFLERKYGAALLDTWESPGPAPDLVIHYTAELAGIYTERSMMRKSHTFKPEAMTLLNMEEKRVMKALKDLDLGKTMIPGVSGADDVLVGREGAGHVFAHEDLIQDVQKKRLDRRLGVDGRILQTDLKSRKELLDSEGPIFDT